MLAIWRGTLDLPATTFRCEPNVTLDSACLSPNLTSYGFPDDTLVSACLSPNPTSDGFPDDTLVSACLSPNPTSHRFPDDTLASVCLSRKPNSDIMMLCWCWLTYQQNSIVVSLTSIASVPMLPFFNCDNQWMRRWEKKEVSSTNINRKEFMWLHWSHFKSWSWHQEKCLIKSIPIFTICGHNS